MKKIIFGFILGASVNYVVASTLQSTTFTKQYVSFEKNISLSGGNTFSCSWTGDSFNFTVPPGKSVNIRMNMYGEIQ